MLSVKTLLESAAHECGWDQDTMINVMIQFIQEDKARHKDFVERVVQVVDAEFTVYGWISTRGEIEAILGLE